MFNLLCCMRFFSSTLTCSFFLWKVMETFRVSNFSFVSLKKMTNNSKFSKLNCTHIHACNYCARVLIYTSQNSKKEENLCKINGAWVIFPHIKRIYVHRINTHTPSIWRTIKWRTSCCCCWDCCECCECFNYAHI